MNDFRTLLAGDAEAKLHGERLVHEILNGHQRLETTHTHSEPRFRALLAEDGDRMFFHREGFDRLDEVSV